MKLRLAACATALGIASGAHAANLPPKFTGMWVATDMTNNKCVIADVKKEANDAPVARVMSVGPGEVAYYETHCKILTVKPIKNLNVEDKNQISADATMTCSGEGNKWETREIWHVETVDGSKIAVVTSLGHTNYRDEKGRKQKDVPNPITTSIYFQCK